MNREAIRTAFAKAGYSPIDILHNGKEVRIFDAEETFSYYATGNYVGNGEYFVFYDGAEDSGADPVDVIKVNPATDGNR